MVERLRAISDDETRAKEAHEVLQQVLDSTREIADIRREAVLALRRRGGWTYVRIAALLKVTKVTASRIARAGDTTDPH